MNFLYFIVLLLIGGCSEVKFPWKTLSFPEAKIQAINNNKMVMIDFYTDW